MLVQADFLEHYHSFLHNSKSLFFLNKMPRINPLFHIQLG